MILYMDVYITNAPLFRNMYDDLTELRSKTKIYNMPDKIDITLYTLASYALYNWSNILIKYELEDKSKNDYFENEVKKIFPEAVIMRGRSDNQAKYQESIKVLEKMKDEFIFYAGNNDHPFVFSDISVLYNSLEKAKELAKDYKYVSVWYSHIQEGAAILKNANFSVILKHNGIFKKDILYEDEKLFVTKRAFGIYPSVQIVNLDLLKHWFCDADLTGKRVRRSDDLASLIETKGQIAIFPKEQICEHFDGYGNLDYLVGFKVYESVPPLFIPPGFFKNDIKIAFGYDEYRKDWVNINPTKKRYSFMDPINGTDMKIGLNNLPLFWKPRISKIDINPKINQQELEALGNKNYEKICNPWPKSLWQVYATKYITSPMWGLYKFLKKNALYIKDPHYLDENKDAGSPIFKKYKHFILFLFKTLGRLK